MAAYNRKVAAPQYAATAWFCLRDDQFPRKQCIMIVSNKIFDSFILALIALNCITMLVFNEPVLKRMIESHPSDFGERSEWARLDRNVPFFNPLPGCGATGPCSVADWIDWVFLVIFGIEMVLKMLALGLCMHQNAYLRSGWNWLDFVVVVVGFVEMYTPPGSLPGLSTLRLVKTLRPLRSLQRVRGMRVLVQCILAAMPQMCSVLIFLFVVIYFFALIGVALFKSGLRYSCHAGSDEDGWESTDQICRPHCVWDENTVELIGNCSSLGANTMTNENMDSIQTWDWVYTCRKGEQCLCTYNGLADPTCDYRSNPNYGITSFDSLPWAFVSLFQAISLEGWVDMMYQLQDGISSWVWTYFVMVVLFGAIIVINLFLAVLCENFDMADKDETEDGDESEGEEGEDKPAGDAAAAETEEAEPGTSLQKLVASPVFDYGVQACIVLNTIIMTMRYAAIPTNALEYSIPPPEMRSTDYMVPALFWFLFYMNIILTAIFALESTIKIIALGPRKFVKDQMNVFDFVVVAISIFEICIDPNITGVEIYFPLPISVLRAFRTFRLFKLARSITSIRKILATLVSSMASVMYLAMLLLLMILIFILLGMELFGGYYPRPELNYTSDKFPDHWDNKKKQIRWEGEASRYHFDDPGNACLAIFVVLSGENWNEIMFHTHEATWDANMASALPIPMAIIYFILLFFVGNLLLFNLFIAILLSNFDDDEEDEDAADDDLTGELDLGKGKLPAPEEKKEMIEWKFNGYKSAQDKIAGMANGEHDAAADDDDAPVKQEMFPGAEAPLTAETSGGDKSLMLFAWSNPVRIYSAKLILHPWFEATIVVLILVSTALMLLDMPTLSATHWSRVFIEQSGIFFTIVFLLEMIFKWIAMGVAVSKTPPGYQLSDAYFRGPGKNWNILDFVIVVISVLLLLGIPALRPLRAFRAFRPLRLVQRYEDLKITVATLFQSVPAMGSLISVAGLFFLIFAILGVELYGGKLGSCMDPDYEDLPYGSRVIPGVNSVTGQNDYEECMSLPRYNITRRTTNGMLFTDMADMFPDAVPNWLDFTEFPQWFYPQFGHYDNLLMSLGLLFEISALEGWPDVMHYCQDSDQDAQFVVPWKVASTDGGGLGGVGSPMGDNVHSPQVGITAIFFIAWIIIGCFVVVNMTVGIVCDTFSQIKAENDGLLLMSDQEADWVRAQRQVFSQRPLVNTKPPAAPWRQPLYRIVNSNRFEFFILSVIVLNVLLMGLDYWEPQFHELAWYSDESPTTAPREIAYKSVNSPSVATIKSVLSAFNLTFLAVYLLEMFVKWIGVGFVQYFKSPADRFDFVLVLISVVEAVLSFMPSATMPIGFIRVMRLFRIVRIMRVVKSAKQMRAIIATVIMSVPQLKNILVLIMLLIIVTDVLCMNLFAFVNYTPGNHDWTPDHAESIARGEVMPKDDAWYYSGDNNWGDMINRHANFQYFWTGMLVLVRSSTGESFNGIMHDLYGYYWGDNRMKCCPECGPMLDGDLVTYTIVRGDDGLIIPGATLTTVQPEDSCGITWTAFAIYFIFQNAMAYIVLSIMIGIILENFSNIGGETRKIRLDDIEEFRELWLKYDPKGTYVIPAHNLLAILQQLPKPLGIADLQPPYTRGEMLKHLGQLDVPDHGGYIHFTETLTAMCNKHGGCPVPECETTKKMRKAANQVPKLKALEAPKHNALTSYLASMMQARIKAHAARTGAPIGAKADGSAPTLNFASQPKPNQVAPAPA